MVILMLVILMLLYLDTGYADSDADLCIELCPYAVNIVNDWYHHQYAFLPDE